MPKLHYRPDIEGLRALAVMAVLAFHFHLGAVNGGFVGVDVFFVISGYLITRILGASLEREGRVDYMAFYGHRAKRLLPALILLIASTICVTAILLPAMARIGIAKTGIAASLYISNIWFAVNSASYFSPDNILNPFLHLWTLSVEEQFYLAWPTLLVFIFRRKPALWLGSLTLASFAASVWFTHWSPTFAFYLPVTRAWEFGVGGLVALPAIGTAIAVTRFRSPLGWTGLVVMVASFFLLDETLPFPGYIAAIPVFATALVIACGPLPAGPSEILKHPALQWVGKRSYSIYLWHWPVIVLAADQFPAMTIWHRLALGGLTLVFADFSLRLVEDPLRRARWLSKSPKKMTLLGIAFSAGGAFICFGSIVLAQVTMSSREREVARVARELPVSAGKGCLSGFSEVAPKPCVFGDAASDQVIALYGDSHADQWTSLLDEIGKREKWKIVTFMKASCSAAGTPTYSMNFRRYLTECDAWREAAIAQISALKPRVVVVGEYTANDIESRPGHENRYTPDLPAWIDTEKTHVAGFDEWRQEMGRTLRRLGAGGAKVLLIRDTPSPLIDMASCLNIAANARRPEGQCAVSRDAAIDPRITDALHAFARSNAGIGMLDLTDRFCDVKSCPPRRSGLLAYRDRNHIAVELSRHLRREMEDAIRALLE